MSKYPTIVDRPDGVVVGVNFKRISECPFFLLPNQPQNQLVIPPGQSLQQVPISISGEGPAQINELTAQRSLIDTVTGLPVAYANPTAIATVFLQIQDGQGMRPLMNGAAHIDTIFGNYDFGTNPLSKGYPLAEALYIDEQRKILVSATDLANVTAPNPATNNIRIAMTSQRLLSRIYDADISRARAKMEKRQYMSMPYFYVLDNGFSTLAAGGTNVETISIGQDSHFELFQLSAVATGGLGSFLINITNQDTGESLFDAPLGVSFPLSSGLVVGSAAFPMRLHEPRFFEVRSKLIVTLVDVSGAPNTVFLTLGGRMLADRMWS